jgi:hypothetical protein
MQECEMKCYTSVIVSRSFFYTYSYKTPSVCQKLLKGTNGSRGGYYYRSYSSWKCFQATGTILVSCCSVVGAHIGFVLQPKGKKCIWWKEILITDLVGTWHRNVFYVREPMKGDGKSLQLLSNRRRLYYEDTRTDIPVTFSISQVPSYPLLSEILRTLVFIT